MTRVALLWHMHQPFYQDLLTGEHILPWVRLHATKDYWGMVALLREHPSVKVTFNLVPSLLVQLEAFARDEARDRHLELGLRDAGSLSEDERAFCVGEFFHAHRARMIDPYPRYRALLLLRDHDDRASLHERASRFSVDDIRDLQVWHKLVWIDPIYHARDQRVSALLAKGRGYSEEDKRTLRAVELEIVRRVIPEYAAAAARGQVELSTSPFYHPILPLLCDSDVYRQTHPQSPMPREPFRHPEDAAEQLQRAVAYHTRAFGLPPRGVWPSEGSISDAIVPLVRRAGLQWMASDEVLLARSLGAAPFTRDAAGHVEEPERLYRAFRVGGRSESVACGFRDHSMSDLIGFSYASWPADAAADDFLNRVTEAGRRYSARTGGEEATIFVILDGENAWESYDTQGRPFLHALYSRLGSHPDVRTVTMSEACAEPSQGLPSVFPGSWINGDFYIWIGHPDDHRAWSQLVDARRAIDGAPASLKPEALARAQEEMLVAEGSDWFWWYGDDHSSAHDRHFDDLFRRHVRNIYEALERPVPGELLVTNITTAPPVGGSAPPEDRIRPTIDGEMTSYFEWLGAGAFRFAGAGGAMHESGEGDVVRRLEYGTDGDRLFIRVDGNRAMRDLLLGGLEVRVRFIVPQGLRVAVRLVDGSRLSVGLERQDDATRWTPRECSGLAGAAGRVLELAIPFACLGALPGTLVEMVLVLHEARRGASEEAYLSHAPITLEVPRGATGP